MRSEVNLGLRSRPSGLPPLLMYYYYLLMSWLESSLQGRGRPPAGGAVSTSGNQTPACRISFLKLYINLEYLEKSQLLLEAVGRFGAYRRISLRG